MSVDPVQEEAVGLIRSVIERTGWSVTQIARQAGIAPSTLTRLYPVPSVKYTLSARTIVKLRELLHAVPGDAPAAHVREERVAFGTDTLPLYGFDRPAEPLEGAPKTELDLLVGSLSDPIGRVRHPAPGTAPERFFCVYMTDDSMKPRFRPGEYLVVDTLRPAAVGDDVLAVFGTHGAGAIACVACLTDRDRTDVELVQYGYSLRDRFPRRSIAQMYPIVGAFHGSIGD